MAADFVIALFTLIFFQWSVNGSINLLQSKIITNGYTYDTTTEILILFGLGNLASALFFNKILKKFGFFRLFLISTITLVTLCLILEVYFNIFIVQLLAPFISITQSFGYFCLMDLFAPMFSSYVQGSFSILIQLGKAISIILPFLMIDKLNIILCVTTLISLVSFITGNINVFLRDYESMADVYDVYYNYNSFFWSCIFMKIGDTILSGYFRIALKMINFSNQQCQYLSTALITGSVLGIIIYAIIDRLLDNTFIIINAFFVVLFLILHYQYGYNSEIIFLLFGLFAYGCFVVLNRYFHRKLLTKFVINKKKAFSIIQTQTHIEYMASILGYIIGGLLIKGGIYLLTIGTIIAHLISWIFVGI